MHSAPAVSYPVGRSHFQGWLVGLTALVGTLTALLWHYQVTTGGWKQWLFVVTLLGSCMVAFRDWRRAPRGILRWDGKDWTWISPAALAGGVVTIHLDLQFCLVLSLRTEAGARIWLWPEQRVEVTRWNALRRAVFSRGGAPHARQANVEVDLLQVMS